MTPPLKIFAAIATLIAAFAVAQQKSTNPPNTAVQSATQQKAPVDPAERTRNALGMGTRPDAEAAKRGAPVYASNCSFCHGPSARGAEGPSLLTSDVVLGDDHGEKMVPFLQQGRPNKGMPAFNRLPDADLKDVTEFLHQQVENYTNRGDYKVANILVGDPAKGKIYFDAKCSKCHSVTGDLAHVGAKFKPLDLQRNWIAPNRNMPSRDVAVAVTTQAGTSQGKLVKLDDFEVQWDDASGNRLKAQRDASTIVELHDPLEFHMQMIPTLQDDDIHNMTAYLEKQK
jgi:mono/diheme cytochrome c family protein